ncbi:hypothetical protein [Acinetobacter sp. NIPH 2100]|uniref:hypothetical protein n=1 Tax=Acinetobacter sp. NIPH 2100 TaxID=1217708 RepID=UPI0002CE1685|nr:hypothetical protein [Acinetobacter sp. NIPH 2100]ENX42597.1 hypothetical protein F887_00760 [Acinetobacter sp. NIPH 2100]
MNNEKFVDGLKLHVRDAAVSDIISKLKEPPGRRILPQIKLLSEWYKSLAEEDITKINSIIELTAHEVLFGVLAVLDGARVIDEEKGQLELVYEIQDAKVRLNNPSEIGLHELLNASN